MNVSFEAPYQHDEANEDEKDDESGARYDADGGLDAQESGAQEGMYPIPIPALLCSRGPRSPVP